MDLCDIRVIEGLLRRHGFHFSKSLGQNFLCDETVPYDIAASAGLHEQIGVVEIGPGIGALSRQLCAYGGPVVAVELDRRLAPLLAETMGDLPNFTLVQGDVLKTDLRALCAEHFDGQEVVACANLPYYITTPAITALLECGCFSSVTVMVQKEVAERICAAPGTKAYGAFSLYVAYHATAEQVLSVPRDCFVPSPKVNSAVVRLVPHKVPPVQADERILFSLIKAAFAQRRKTMSN